MDVIGTVVSILFTSVFVLAIIVSLAKFVKEMKAKQHMEEYKRKKELEGSSAESEEERRRRQEELKRRLAKKYDVSEDDAAAKHAAHVADSHAHGHTGEEEHYDEIVGSLGEVNDEGCTDLNGVRFIANDIAYELQT